MALRQLENIRVVLAEPNQNLRRSIKSILVKAGMKNVLDTDDISQVRRVIDNDLVELVIGDDSSEYGDFNKLIYDMRHRDVGENPFLIAVTMLQNPSSDVIRGAMNSGTDHILAKPVEPDALINLIIELTQSRKRFVVTTDYIGPDRRTTARPGTMTIPQIDVPNPLRQRMTGQMRETTQRRTIETAWGKINEQKVERYAFQIGWLLDRIVPEVGIDSEEYSDDFHAHVSRLIKVSRDMSKRIDKTSFAHVKEKTMTMTYLVEESMENGFTPEGVILLLKLSDIISDSFDANRFTLDGTQARDHSVYDEANRKVAVMA